MSPVEPVYLPTMTTCITRTRSIRTYSRCVGIHPLCCPMSSAFPFSAIGWVIVRSCSTLYFTTVPQPTSSCPSYALPPRVYLRRRGALLRSVVFTFVGSRSCQFVHPSHIHSLHSRHAARLKCPSLPVHSIHSSYPITKHQISVTCCRNISSDVGTSMDCTKSV